MSRRSYDHIKAQRNARESTNHTCEVTGKRGNVDAHHIFEHQYGGPAIEENLIVVDRDLHKAIHQKDSDFGISRFE